MARVALMLSLVAAAASAAEWPDWRGPNRDGVSEETGLISSWSKDGENLIWRQDFVGRSTPIVLRGRVFVTGRTGAGPTQREIVAAFDAQTGEKVWQRDISTALTTVPFTRTGWASPVGDPETGYIYVQGVAGPFVCFDQDGNVVWERHLYEEFGRYSGYGGRTHTPLVDEDRVIVNVINNSWGKLGPPRHRYFAFDKRTGDVLWITTPGPEPPADLNAQGNGTIAVIDGRRLYVGGSADGWVYALDARTGKKIWEFRLSKGYINSTPTVLGSRVIVGHSEENIDVPEMGRVIAIDGTGTGEITTTHELWRAPIAMGFPTPLVHGGRAYVMDNSANFFALDVETGAVKWEHNLGTVGKSAPVWADGKIYVTEVNGWFHILEPGEDGVKTLDSDQLTMPEGRYAELYASPAIAYGRIYFTTEEGLYCLGDPKRPFELKPSPPQRLAEERKGSGQPTTLLLVPGDVTVKAGDSVSYTVRAFDDMGQSVAAPANVEWSVEGLRGSFGRPGVLGLTGQGHQTGEVVAKVGELEARARVRAFGDLPFHEDFESVTGRGRPWWIGAGRYQVIEMDGGKVLEKPLPASGLPRSALLIGPPGLENYVIQADVRGTQQGRRRSDVGVINNGYMLDLKGVRQELEVKTWEAEKRIAVAIPYTWDVDTWYTIKLDVEHGPDKAVVLGKVWKRGEPEPAEWTVRTEDPIPVKSGAPGLIAYSPASAFFDNVHVTPDQTP
ncbi:MAG TPA: PQQ-binding-like beta-propeller repeat protein [Thermoanaerobaculia bacterium]|nr:PQQ-binding-like beta-propeller repeat protein [Thermoanaerobaculia bacterium]